VIICIDPGCFRGRKRGIYARQRVTLTGLGIKAFQEAIDSIIIIHSLFSRHLPHGSLEQWMPTNYMDHLAINLANRYFSEKRHHPKAVPIPFPAYMDPKRILADMQGDKLIHCEENSVQYYEAIRPSPTDKTT
jgi:hypothetical protein